MIYIFQFFNISFNKLLYSLSLHDQDHLLFILYSIHLIVLHASFVGRIRYLSHTFLYGLNIGFKSILFVSL